MNKLFIALKRSPDSKINILAMVQSGSFRVDCLRVYYILKNILTHRHTGMDCFRVEVSKQLFKPNMNKLNRIHLFTSVKSIGFRIHSTLRKKKFQETNGGQQINNE